MPGPNQFTGDVVIDGTLVPKRITMPVGSVPATAIPAAANVEASKLEQQLRPPYRQGSAATAADAREVIHVAKGDGSLFDLKAGLVDANVGDSEVDVDLLKNGVSILTAPITLDSGDADYALVAAAIATAAYVAGDVFEISVDATVGTGTLGKGLFAVPTFREKAQ